MFTFSLFICFFISYIGKKSLFSYYWTLFQFCLTLFHYFGLLDASFIGQPENANSLRNMENCIRFVVENGFLRSIFKKFNLVVIWMINHATLNNLMKRPFWTTLIYIYFSGLLYLIFSFFRLCADYRRYSHSSEYECERSREIQTVG